MNGRLTDLQDQVTTLESKYSTAEKARLKLQNQVTTLTADCDSVTKKFKHKNLNKINFKLKF